MHHIAFSPHALHHLISSHIYVYAIDHAESEPEELQEQVQAEDTNTDSDQGKHRCIQTPTLDSCFILVIFL
jgi:hypothetical protein